MIVISQHIIGPNVARVTAASALASSASTYARARFMKRSKPGFSRFLARLITAALCHGNQHFGLTTGRHHSKTLRIIEVEHIEQRVIGCYTIICARHRFAHRTHSALEIERARCSVASSCCPWCLKHTDGALCHRHSFSITATSYTSPLHAWCISRRQWLHIFTCTSHDGYNGHQRQIHFFHFGFMYFRFVIVWRCKYSCCCFLPISFLCVFFFYFVTYTKIYVTYNKLCFLVHTKKETSTFLSRCLPSICEDSDRISLPIWP